MKALSAWTNQALNCIPASLKGTSPAQFASIALTTRVFWAGMAFSLGATTTFRRFTARPVHLGNADAAERVQRDVAFPLDDLKEGGALPDQIEPERLVTWTRSFVDAGRLPQGLSTILRDVKTLVDGIRETCTEATTRHEENTATHWGSIQSRRPTITPGTHEKFQAILTGILAAPPTTLADVIAVAKRLDFFLNTTDLETKVATDLAAAVTDVDNARRTIRERIAEVGREVAAYDGVYQPLVDLKDHVPEGHLALAEALTTAHEGYIAGIKQQAKTAMDTLAGTLGDGHDDLKARIGRLPTFAGDAAAVRTEVGAIRGELQTAIGNDDGEEFALLQRLADDTSDTIMAGWNNTEALITTFRGHLATLIEQCDGLLELDNLADDTPVASLRHRATEWQSLLPKHDCDANFATLNSYKEEGRALEIGQINDVKNAAGRVAGANIFGGYAYDGSDLQQAVDRVKVMDGGTDLAGAEWHQKVTDLARHWQEAQPRLEVYKGMEGAKARNLTLFHVWGPLLVGMILSSGYLLAGQSPTIFQSLSLRRAS